MAKRRSPIKRGLSAAFRGAGDTFAQVYAMLQQQENQKELIREREASQMHEIERRDELDRAQWTDQFKAQQEAAKAALAAKRPEDAATAVQADIAKSTTPEDVPSPNQIVSQMRSAGEVDPFFGGKSPRIKIPAGPSDPSRPALDLGEQVAMPMRPEGQAPSRIEDLIRQSQIEKENQFAEVKRLAQEEFDKKEFIDPTGIKVAKGPDGSVKPLERTGTQEGQRTKDTDMLGKFSPEMMAAEAKRAGLISDAQERAKAKWAATNSGLTPSMQAGVQRLTTSVAMLESLEPYLTQKPGVKGKLEGGLQRMMLMFGADTPGSLYDAVSDSLLPALARSSGEVGNLAEREQTRYAKLAPRVSDPVNIRRAKLAAIQFIIDGAQKGKKAEELAPFLDYLQFVTPETGTGATPVKRVRLSEIK